MNPLRTQSALKIVLPFCVGIVLGQRFSFPISLLFGFAGTTLLLLIWSYFRQRQVLFVVAAIVAIMIIAVVRTSFCFRFVSADDLRYFISCEPSAVEGVIVGPIEHRVDRQTFDLQVDSVWQKEQGHPASGLLYVQLYDTLAPLCFGDRLLLKGFLSLPMAERNPGDFNFRQYLAGRGIFAGLTVKDFQPLLLAHGQGPWLDQQIFMPIRTFFYQFLFHNMLASHAAVLYGLLIGDRSEMDDQVEQDFRDVGVVHVLAVSGMHVGFVIAALYFILLWLPFHYTWRTLILLVGIWFYAHLTGMQSPVARAALMAGLLLLAPLLQRRAEPLNIIAIAALVILIIHPLQLFMPGFQLSFAACLGMLLLYKRFRPLLQELYERRGFKRKPVRYIMNLMVISLCAQIATLPIILYYFNNLPLIALVANIPVIPFTGVIMGCGFIAVSIGALLPGMGVWLMQIMEALIIVLIKLVHTFRMIPFSHFTTPQPSLLTIIICFFLIGLLIYWPREKLQKRFLVVSLLLLNLYVWDKVRREPNQLRVTFFDVGQGDAVLFEFPDRRTLLVDGGDHTDYVDYGERVLAPYLRRNGIRRIDNVVITHPHTDHLGGIAYIMKNYRIGRILCPKIEYSDSLTEYIDKLAFERRIVQHSVCRGDTISGYTHTGIYVLNPSCRDSLTTPAELNDRSLVLKVVFGRNSFLLTGDAGIEAEAEWLWMKDLLRSDVIKVAHHGSSTASSQNFCDMVLPQFAVISVGRYNRFNLPSPSVVERWSAVAGQVSHTADQGAVVFTCDGSRIKRIR